MAHKLSCVPKIADYETQGVLRFIEYMQNATHQWSLAL
jgi:hypothetical protein